MSELAALSLVVSLLFSELTGLVPGGIIVPFYFALYITDYAKIGATLLSSLLAYGAVRMLSRYAILYGRRRFTMYLLFGLLFKFLFSYLSVGNTYMLSKISMTIGYLVPGILGNNMEKQGVGKTLFSLAFCTVLIYLVEILLK